MFFAYYFLKVHLLQSSKIKSHKISHKIVQIKVFLFFFACQMEGSVSGSGRPNNLRIRIHRTDWENFSRMSNKELLSLHLVCRFITRLVKGQNLIRIRSDTFVVRILWIRICYFWIHSLFIFWTWTFFRRHICEFLDQLLHTWPTHALEKHVALLQVILPKHAEKKL